MAKPPKIRVAVKLSPPKLNVDIPTSGNEIVTGIHPESSLPIDIPTAGDETRLDRSAQPIELSTNIPTSGDERRSDARTANTEIRTDIPASEDEVSAYGTPRSPKIGTDIPGADDEYRATREVRTPGISMEIPPSSDERRIGDGASLPKIQIDIPSAGDESRAERSANTSGFALDIPASDDEVSIYGTPRTIPVNADIPSAGDEYRQGRDAPVPALPLDIPGAGDESRLTADVRVPEIPQDIPASDDDVSMYSPSRSVTVSGGIPVAGDEKRVTPTTDTPSIQIDIPSSGDEHRVGASATAPTIPLDIPSADDEVSAYGMPRTPDIRTEVPSAGDETRLVRNLTPPEISLDVPASGDEVSIYGAPRSAPISTEIPGAGDEVKTTRAVKTPTVSPGIPPSGDEVRLLPVLREKILGNIPAVGDDSRSKRRELSFTGRWLPKGDPLNIGAENYATLQNFRYTDWGLEGVGGYSRINTLTTNGKLTNGIQLKTPYTQATYILMQNHETVGGAKSIIQHKGAVTATPTTGDFDTFFAFVISGNNKLIFQSKTGGTTSDSATIQLIDKTYSSGDELAEEIALRMNGDPILTQGLITFDVSYSSTTKIFTISASPDEIRYTNTGSTAGSIIGFSATQEVAFATSIVGTAVVNDVPLYAETSGAGLARFSKLPFGNIGICDGKENLIYAGDEMPVGAFLLTRLVPIDSTTLGSMDINGFIDYTKEVNNSLTDADNLAIFYSEKAFGDATSRFDITFSAPHTTYTWDGTGTDPNFATNGLATGDVITINSSNFSATNNGTFIVTAVADSYITVLNYYGVAQTDKLLSAADSMQAPDTSMFLVGSTRKLKAVNVTVNTANTLAATMNGYNSNGYAFASMPITDGTASGGKTLAQSGTISWPTISFDGTGIIDDVYEEKPIYINGYYLYFYLFTFTVCNARISRVTVNTSIQNYTDMWDGIFRTCIYFLVRRNGAGNADVMSEFTLEVAGESAEATPLGGEIGSLNWDTGGANAEYVVVMFEERCNAINVKMFEGKINVDAATITVQYWNGTAWAKVLGVVDRTRDSGGTKSLSQSGIISWGYVNPLYEKIYKYRGHEGYAYKLYWSAELEGDSADDVVIDSLTGIRTCEEITMAYTFPMMYRNRSMLCGCISDGELNRVDYSPKNSPDMYNGNESSGYGNPRSIYFGGKDALTAGIEFYHQFGDSVNSVGLFFKNTETYLLAGDMPSTFTYDQISYLIGCPAPLTVTQAEIATESGVQNVILWISDRGPMVYQNHSLTPIRGIEPYFDPSDTLCVNAAYIAEARAWYDATYREWNVLIPSGSTATGNNVWLVLDLQRMKWYERTHTNDFPIGGFTVQDIYGNSFNYGYTAGGYLLRMEYGLLEGTTGYGITNTVKTADILFGASMWDDIEIRLLKVLFAANAGTMAISHYGDGNETATVDTGFPTAKSMAYSGYRYRNLIQQVYQGSTARGFIRALSHAFKFVTSACSAVKPKLIGWGVQYDDFKENTKDKDE